MSQIRFPTGLNMLNCLGFGLTGIAYLQKTSGTVIKFPHEGTERAIDVERRIYERFQQHGGHEGLLLYYGPFEIGIQLEYASLGSLRAYFEIHHKIDAKDRLRWSQQITSALAFVHSMNVIHGDLTCHNISLDDNQNAKLLDFGGSSLDGSEPLIAATNSHMWPGDDNKSPQVDIFALGSTLYEIWTGKPPFHQLESWDPEITNSFKRSEFPETKSLGPIGDVIRGCWQGRFASADDVVKAINSCSRTSLLTSVVDFVSAPPVRETTMGLHSPGRPKKIASRNSLVMDGRKGQSRKV
ncbi:kinase-like protein [Trematosphaeria pertusa]|uniref:Kinase-like protein n=1 Tax=Trematosphaeria pertusa TaxID=390896 RepID=A0A6A6HU35_9PLEO|nr:kinase-like protein [Trematosphaeria pertusa]KAF2241429.1 kinase-like protein [Trematosphaeria pertusa]